jgi:SAM-dependent methyltransferase
MKQLSARILQKIESLGFDSNRSNVVEVGCGPGGLTFELAAQCGPDASVIGIDHSAHHISTAKALLSGESVACVLPSSGNLELPVDIQLSRSVVGVGAKKVDFRVSDPMSLPAEMMHFDLVVLHDVLDTIAAPNSLLGRLGGARGLVKPGTGLLVVSSGYKWCEECTPKDLWIGGYEATATATGAGASSSSSGNASASAYGSNAKAAVAVQMGMVRGAGSSSSSSSSTTTTTSSSSTSKVVVRPEEALVAKLAAEGFEHVGSEPLVQMWCTGERDSQGCTHTISYFRRK